MQEVGLQIRGAIAEGSGRTGIWWTAANRACLTKLEAMIERRWALAGHPLKATATISVGPDVEISAWHG
jgi:hypothetical protein